MVSGEEILSLYKRDEKAAMQLLFEVYYDSLLLYCYRLIHDVGEAEDIIQEYFVHLWFSHRLRDFEGNLDHFMFQSVKFRAMNSIRDKQRKDQKLEASVSGEYVMPDILGMEEEEREIELLYSTINRLPDKCRRIFLMVCLDGMKYQEIADALQISINTVKTQMKIALRFLREHLSEESFSSVLLLVVQK